MQIELTLSFVGILKEIPNQFIEKKNEKKKT